MRLRLQTIAMRHCQKKVMHMLFVAQFAVLDANDYFALMSFQMAPSTLQTITMCLLREGYARATTCCTVHRFQRRQLQSSGGGDGFLHSCLLVP
jgi:hypothetical protein